MFLMKKTNQNQNIFLIIIINSLFYYLNYLIFIQIHKAMNPSRFIDLGFKKKRESGQIKSF